MKGPANTVVHDSVLVGKPKKSAELKKVEQEEVLLGLKERLFQESMTVVADTLRFREIDPQHAQDPVSDPAYMQIVDECDGDHGEAMKIYRVALAGWSSAKDQPSGVKVASAMVIGILKANAAEKGGDRTLNIGRVILTATLPQFEERDME